MILLSAAAALISLVRYCMWAPKHNAMDGTVAAALVIGILLNLVLAAKDEDLLVVLSAVCYSYALFRHLTSQVGFLCGFLSGNQHVRRRHTGGNHRIYRGCHGSGSGTEYFSSIYEKGKKKHDKIIFS